MSCLDWSVFNITGSDGKTYRGIRPGLIPKPFSKVEVIIDGRVFIAKLPPGGDLTEGVTLTGYDAFIGVGLNPANPSQQDHVFKIQSIYSNGKSYWTYINPEGLSFARWE